MTPGEPWLTTAAAQFVAEGVKARVRRHGSGNVNDTFLVIPGPAEGRPFILQRINGRVFPHPELIMTNTRVVTVHMRDRLGTASSGAGLRWEVPRLLTARDGRDFWTDPEGALWRAFSLIDDAESRDVVGSVAQAREVGYALGTFQRLISDLPPEKLHDTLEGFHVTPRYIQRYKRVLAGKGGGLSPDEEYCLRFVEERKACASILEDARETGKLRLRPIHGDPKVNNVMMEPGTGRAVGMVDLDTVKPGLVHYDVGDCLRSCCNPLGEETAHWGDVRFDTDLCRAVLQGYVPQAKAFLTPADHEYLYDAVRLIAFELGLRFFTDHLEGDVYFRTSREGHNLARALVQFRLAESIESQEPAIRSILRDLR